MNYIKFTGLSLIIVSAFYGHHMQGMFGMTLQGIGLTRSQQESLERKARIEKENILIQQAIIDGQIESFRKDQIAHFDGSFGMNSILFKKNPDAGKWMVEDHKKRVCKERTRKNNEKVVLVATANKENDLLVSSLNKKENTQ